MKAKAEERLNRILLMVPYMTGGDGASIEMLCRRFGIDRDELMKDLHVLWMCGVPDYTPGDLIGFRVDGDRVYVTMAEYFERPLRLTREEALMLLIAGRAIIRAGVLGADGPLASALEKVQSILAEGERGEVEGLARRIDLEMHSYSGRWKRIIDKGLKEGRNLLIEYFSFSRDEVSSREVEPVSLIWSRGFWYLQAWCRSVDDMRLFRLDRIKDVALSKSKVTDGRRRDPELPDMVCEYRPGRRAHEVRLALDGSRGRRLLEEWPAATASEDEEGMTIKLRTRNLNWLASFLLRFGDGFTILSPDELSRLVSDKAEKMLELYA